MQLLTHLNELMLKYRETEAGLSRRLGIDRNHLREIRSGRFKQISRLELQRLMTWAAQRDEELFSLRRHPIWDTFLDRRVLIIRGRAKDDSLLTSDSRIEAVLLDALNTMGCSVDNIMNPSTIVEVRKLLTTRNCIFSGGPKHNVASAIAMALLWQAEPFDTSAENRRRVPIGFAWPEGFEPARKTALTEPVEDWKATGIRVSPHTRTGKTLFFEADYWPYHEFLAYAGKCRDTGALVVCRKPLGTKQNVTTVVIAGYSALCSWEMTKDLVDETLDIDEGELADGVPVVRVLRVLFKKRAKETIREPLKQGREWIGPPWTGHARNARVRGI